MEIHYIFGSGLSGIDFGAIGIFKLRRHGRRSSENVILLLFFATIISRFVFVHGEFWRENMWLENAWLLTAGLILACAFPLDWMFSRNDRSISGQDEN